MIRDLPPVKEVQDGFDYRMSMYNISEALSIREAWFPMVIADWDSWNLRATQEYISVYNNTS